MKHLDSSMKYSRLKVEEFSIFDLLEKEEAQYYQDKLTNNNISFEIDKKNDFRIKANKGRLIQVFDNLMNNRKERDEASDCLSFNNYWMIAIAT